ncbi:MAG: hypothetical protein IT449_08720 [Phycisphaerales bacterium]|nr:hypothetical protein [Phycisphaerales bacterium]
MKSCVSRLFFASLAVLAPTLPAFAQQRWSPPNKDKGMLQWVVMLGILILICIPSFMNPKRSHQS